MAIDSARKRAAAITVTTPGIVPSVRPDGALTAFDRFSIGWSYKAAASGSLTFYATALENGVDTNLYDGVTMDDDGNLRASGVVYEGP